MPGDNNKVIHQTSDRPNVNLQDKVKSNPPKKVGIYNPKSKEKSKPRLRPSIKKDKVHPSDFLKYDTRFSCEDCTHFNHLNTQCTIGYEPSHHLKKEQERQYHLSGNMAFCRFLEID